MCVLLDKTIRVKKNDNVQNTAKTRENDKSKKSDDIIQGYLRDRAHVDAQVCCSLFLRFIGTEIEYSFWGHSGLWRRPRKLRCASVVMWTKVTLFLARLLLSDALPHETGHAHISKKDRKP